MVLIHEQMPPAPSRKLNDNHRPDSQTNIVYTASKGLTTYFGDNHPGISVITTHFG